MKFSITVLFFIINGIGLLNAQAIDSIEMILINNDLFFSQLVSKYYPLSVQQIETYKDYLDFDLLSENINLPSSDKLIEDYKQQWDYIKLQRNKGVFWNQERIDKYYLEPWFSLYLIAFNRKVYVDEEFFYKHFKYFQSSKILESDRANKVLLYSKKDSKKTSRLGDYLYERYKKKPLNDFLSNSLMDPDTSDIKGYNASFLLEHSDIIDWEKYASSEVIDWNFNKLKILRDKVRLKHLIENESIYKNVFSLVLDDVFVENRFQSILMNNKEQLFPLKENRLKVNLVGLHELNDRDLKSLDSIFTKEPSLFNVTLGTYFGGVPKLLDYYEFRRSFYRQPVRVISKKFLKILQQYNISGYHVFPIELSFDSYWFGKEKETYYFLYLDELDFDDINFKESRVLSKDLFLCKERELDSIEIEYIKNRRFSYFHIFRSDKENYWIQTIVYNGYNDLTHNGNGELLISNRLLEAFKEYNIEGINADYYYRKDFKMSEDPTSYSIDKSLSRQSIQQNTWLEFEQQKDSITHLVRTSSFEEYLDEKDIDVNQLSDFERKHEIIFPEEYKEMFSKNEFSDISVLYPGYSYFSVKQVYPVFRLKYVWFPFLRKGIEIGENESGDRLVLILEEDDPFQLSSSILKIESLQLIPPAKIGIDYYFSLLPLTDRLCLQYSLLYNE